MVIKLQSDLIPLKALNFFSQAALACFLPYKSIIQKQLGISEAQNGIIMAVEKLFSMLAPSLMGSIADKYSVHKPLMIVCTLLTIAFSLPIYFIPSVIESVSFKNNGSCVVAKSNSNYSGTVCWYENVTLRDCDPAGCILCNVSCQQTSENFGSTFFIMLLLSIFFVFAYVPLSSLIDATTMYILGEDRLHLFGVQRLWGAVGFGLLGLLAGYLVDVYSQYLNNPVQKDYLFAFIFLAVLQCFTAAIIFGLKVPQNKLPSLLTGLRVLLKNVDIFLLLLVVFVSGFNLGTRYAFTFWYIEQLDGSNQTLLGLAVLSGCFSEIPTFFISGWIIKKFGSPLVLSVGLLASALQCYLYTIITVAWPIVLIETLHGISFALPMAAMCTYSAVLAPKGMTATLVGVTQGVYWGLGNMCGAFVSGILYQVYGAKPMFYINSVIAVVGALLYIAATSLLHRGKQKESEVAETEAKDQMLEGDPTNA